MFQECKRIVRLSCQKRLPSNIANLLSNQIWPLLLKLKNHIQEANNLGNCDLKIEINKKFATCCSQLKKYIERLFDILKIEHNESIQMHETRNFIIECLDSCFDQLNLIHHKLEENSLQNVEQSLSTQMYFVDWIDHIFEQLTALSTAVYENAESVDFLKYICDIVSSVYLTIDELILSSITLANHCLPTDQKIINARCQVVLRETKSLISEIVDCDLNNVHKLEPDDIRLPVKPSNIGINIDVLRDSLYLLESNMNTSLLAVLIDTFSDINTNIRNVAEHYRVKCMCTDENDCDYVQAFDSYNDSLLHIVNFAVSCSSEEKRTIELNSSMKTLELLEVNLIPSIIVSSESRDTKYLIDMYLNQVDIIKTNVLLTVDPVAFMEKVKEMMKVLLTDIIRLNTTDNLSVQKLIQIGQLVSEFFNIYETNEPDALNNDVATQDVLKSLYKALNECKHVYKNITIDVNITFERLLKRLKLLFTLINRIYKVILAPNIENSFGNDNVHETVIKRVMVPSQTRTIQTPNKTMNLTKSIFRIENSKYYFPAERIANKLIEKRMNNEFNFSLKQLDCSDETYNHIVMDKFLSSISKSASKSQITRSKARNSLRKAVLKRISINTFQSNEVIVKHDKTSSYNTTFDLQLSEILDQLSDISQMPSSTITVEKGNNVKIKVEDDNSHRNVLNISINDCSSYVGNTTMDRVQDLQILDQKLAKLKSSDV